MRRDLQSPPLREARREIHVRFPSRSSQLAAWNPELGAQAAPESSSDSHRRGQRRSLWMPGVDGSAEHAADSIYPPTRRRRGHGTECYYVSCVVRTEYHRGATCERRRGAFQPFNFCALFFVYFFIVYLLVSRVLFVDYGFDQVALL